MKIKEITHQHRRDFEAILECEHCQYEGRLMDGYDDDNYHRNVIPTFACPECGKKAPDNYRPLTTKYPEGFVI